MKKHIISITGDLASGKGTVSSLLISRLNYSVYRNGEAFREMAKEHGMDLIEFNEYVDQHPEIEEILKNAEIIADGSNRKITKVAIGTIVTFKDLSTGETETYAIVDTVESDPFEHRISHSCPLGQALVGRSVGDKIEVKVAEPYVIEIIEIKAL